MIVEGQTFERTLRLGCNSSAYGRCSTFAESIPAAKALLLFGPSGLGKTHFLSAVGYAWQNPNRVLWTNGERFGRQLQRCTSSAHLGSFRDRYRHAELLLIDDLHCFVEDKAVEKEFAQILCAHGSHGRRALFASLHHPLMIRGLCSPIRDWLEQHSVCIELLPPSRYERHSFLKAYSVWHGYSVSDHALERISDIPSDSFFEVIGRLARDMAQSDKLASAEWGE